MIVAGNARGLKSTTASSTQPKCCSSTSNSGVETGIGSDSSFSTVQNFGSIGRSFDSGCLELMIELFLAIALPFGMRLGELGDINQVQTSFKALRRSRIHTGAPLAFS